MLTDSHMIDGDRDRVDMSYGNVTQVGGRRNRWQAAKTGGGAADTGGGAADTGGGAADTGGGAADMGGGQQKQVRGS